MKEEQGEVFASVKRGLKDSDEGRVRSRGSFSQYVEGDEGSCNMMNLHFDRQSLPGGHFIDVYSGEECCVAELYDWEDQKVSVSRWQGPLALKQCLEYVALLDEGLES